MAKSPKLRPRRTRRPVSPSGRWRQLQAALTLVVAFGIGLSTYWLFRPSPATRTDNILSWPREVVLASPDNTKTFLAARLAYIAQALPPNFTHPLIEPESIRDRLTTFLASGDLEWALEQIKTGRRLAQANPELKLYLLPDWHIDTSMGETNQDEKSRRRQRWISQTIASSRPSLAFVEGYDGIMNWETKFRENLALGQQLGVAVPKTIAEFRTKTLARGFEEWTFPFLDEPTIELYGIDREWITTVEMMIDSLTPSSPELAKIIEGTNQLSTYHFREQMILGRCIAQMHERKVSTAYLVLGESHRDSFSALCRDWGVGLTILEPPTP